VEAAVRGEPRFAIVCFFLSTLWEFLQIELVKAMHERKVLKGHYVQSGEDRLLFDKVEIPILIHLAAIGLYAWGCLSEFIYISTSDYGSDEVCIKSYNLPQLGSALVNEIGMTANSAPGQSRFLYLVYVVLCVALPILAHLIQMTFIIGRVQSRTMEALIRWASVVWCFAGIEVLVIGILAVQSKFEQFIVNVANIENDAFLGDVKSGLGSGFYVLIAYSVVACFLQFSLGIRRSSTPYTQMTSTMGQSGNEKENPV